MVHPYGYLYKSYLKIKFRGSFSLNQLLRGKIWFYFDIQNYKLDFGHRS